MSGPAEAIRLQLAGWSIDVAAPGAWSVVVNDAVPSISLLAPVPESSVVPFADNVTFTLGGAADELDDLRLSSDAVVIREDRRSVSIFDLAGQSMTSVQEVHRGEEAVVVTASTLSERFHLSWPLLESVLASIEVGSASVKGLEA